MTRWPGGWPHCTCVRRATTWSNDWDRCSEKHSHAERGQREDATMNRNGTIKRRTLLAAAAAFSGSASPAWAQGAGAALKEVPRNRTYIVASTVDGPVLTNVNNANFFGPGVDLRNGMMYATEPLFWYNFFKDEHMPWLAESYAYNDDFTALTIKLRAGAAWSDGHPFTARDVAFTYNMLIENGATKRNLR